MRVVLADTCYLRREGLLRLLAENDVEVVAVATECALLDAVGRLRPGAVITGIAAPLLREVYPHVGVVVLDDIKHLKALVRRGTAGLALLEHVSDLDELLRALHAVAAGWVDPRVVDALLTQEPLSTLTARELDVVRHMAQGWTNRAIAQALTLAESTVEKHVNTTFAKLGLGERPGLHRRVAAVLAYLGHHDRYVRAIPSLRE